MRLETTKSDSEKAAEYRAKLVPLLEHACAILNSARSEGLIVGFNVNPDQYGRHRIQAIDVTRPL